MLVMNITIYTKFFTFYSKIKVNNDRYLLKIFKILTIKNKKTKLSTPNKMLELCLLVLIEFFFLNYLCKRRGY